MSNLFFAYGTLKKQFHNPAACHLHENATLVSSGKCNAKMYCIKNSYPGMILSTNTQDWVLGEIWRLHEPERTLRILDDYEECSEISPQPHEYERSINPILSMNQTIGAWSYIYKGSIEANSRIFNGIFE
jgi:gamma-glutamylcyclotransferase (GGCT)/AIG2-like uncharacterized protein YtfP